MLRTLLIATALLTTSGAALAHSGDSYGRVVTVEPHFAISFGTRHHDGFNVLYESGGSRYWTYSPYYPDRVIVLPPPHRVQHGYRYRDYGNGWEDRDGWRGRRDWNDRRDGWRDDRRDHRRGDRRHDRD
jgi:hypothetical protein